VATGRLSFPFVVHDRAALPSDTATGHEIPYPDEAEIYVGGYSDVQVMGRDQNEADGECTRCGDYGFTVHRRKGRRYPYPCPACEREEEATVLDAQRVLAEHGDDLRTTYAR
jgi:ribosomal protein L37E